MSDTDVQQIALVGEVFQRVGRRIVEQGRYLFERKSQLPVGQYLMEPFDVGVVVDAVAGMCARRRRHQADLVVVVQRSHADSDEPRRGADRQHFGMSFAHSPHLRV